MIRSEEESKTPMQEARWEPCIMNYGVGNLRTDYIRFIFPTFGRQVGERRMRQEGSGLHTFCMLEGFGASGHGVLLLSR